MHGSEALLVGSQAFRLMLLPRLLDLELLPIVFGILGGFLVLDVLELFLLDL